MEKSIIGILSTIHTLKKLPDEIIDYLYKIAERQITNENKQDTNMKTENRKRNVVRLTESQLKQMIAESVKNVLKEAYSIPKNIDIYDDKRMGVIPYILKIANLYRDLH